MFYGADFSVGEFIYKSIIPVTLGNIVGGAGFAGLSFWYLYGRNDALDAGTGQPVNVEKRSDGEERSVQSSSSTAARVDEHGYASHMA